jgi:hypothetical protein
MEALMGDLSATGCCMEFEVENSFDDRAVVESMSMAIDEDISSSLGGSSE